MGKHSKQGKMIRAGSTTALTAAVIVAACGGVANAAPSQGGVATPPSQGGVVTPPSQGGVATTAPAAPWVPVPPAYQVAPTKPIPNYNYETGTYTPPSSTTYIPPIDYSQLHLPTTVQTPTQLIIAPRDTIRFGNYLIKQPNWVSNDTTARTNATTSAIEAQVTDFWISTGVPADAAQRLAAAQIAGVAGGAITGALAAGVPAALVAGTIGGLIGGTIGGNAGIALGNVIVPGIGWVPGGVAGTFAGAGIGVAVGAAGVGIPAAIVGAAAGGVTGLVVATAFGDGKGGEPINVDVPDIDQPAITAQTQQTLKNWQTNPVGAAAASTVREANASAATLDRQARAAVTALPGGEQAVTGFDHAAADFQKATVIPGLPLGMIANAIGTGIPA